MNTATRNYWSILLSLCLPVLFFTAPAAAQTAADGQAPTLFGGCPESNIEESAKSTNYSLYYENYKNEDYASARPFLRWMLKCAPTFAGSGVHDDRNLDRGVKTYGALAEAAEDQELARSYADSALTIIEQALPILEANDAVAENDRFQWTFRKGYFIQSHSDLLSDRRGEIADAYAKAYEIAPDKMDAYYLNYLLDTYASSQDFAQLNALLQDIQSNYADEQKKMALVEKYMAAIPPQQRIEYIEGRLEEDPDNLELIKQAFQLHRNLGNRARLFELGEQLSSMEPTPEVTRMLGSMYLGDGRSAEALEMYQKLVEMPDADPTAMDYYNMGIANRQMDRLASARTYFRKAIELDSSFGQAYMAIGDLYVTAVSGCSGPTDRADRAVYWLAADYYRQAKNADSSLANTANQRLNTYRGQFPTQEDLFFWNKTSGDPYQVDYGCYSWINESTTVRNPS